MYDSQELTFCGPSDKWNSQIQALADIDIQNRWSQLWRWPRDIAISLCTLTSPNRSFLQMDVWLCCYTRPSTVTRCLFNAWIWTDWQIGAGCRYWHVWTRLSCGIGYSHRAASITTSKLRHWFLTPRLRPFSIGWTCLICTTALEICAFQVWLCVWWNSTAATITTPCNIIL